MNITKKFEENYLLAAEVAAQAQLENANTPVWLLLLRDLNKQVRIFKVDANGNLILNEKGFPVLDGQGLWFRLLSNLPTIIAYIARVWQEARGK